MEHSLGLRDRKRECAASVSARYPGPRGFPFFFFPMREPRSGEKEKPLVTLDLNLTFMQTPGSGSDPRALIG